MISYKDFVSSFDIKQNYIKEKNFGQSYLSLLFNNLPNENNLDLKIINLLKRTCQNNILVFAFPMENISINTNTTSYDNDYIKRLLSTLYIPNQKDINDNYTLFIDVENKNINTINITTDDISLFKNNTIVEKAYKKKILLFKLKQNQKLQLQCNSNKNIGKNASIYCTNSGTVYIKKDTNLINFYIESIGQYTEKDIIIKACDNIIKSLQELSLQTYNIKEDIQEIIFYCDRGYVELLNSFMQLHYEYSGLNVPTEIENDYFIIKAKISKDIKFIFEMCDSIFTIIKNKIRSLDILDG